MKRTLLTCKLSLISICLIFVLFINNTEAQSVLWGNIDVETPVVRCGDNGQIIVNFTISGEMTNGTIEVRLPVGVNYANNLSYTRSEAGTITHDGSSPSNKPVFILGSVASGEVFSITFDRSFNCSTLSSVVDTIIAYDKHIQVGSKKISPLYNIQGASLSVAGISNTPILGNVGADVTRKVSITNQNFGYVKSFTYLDKFPANSFQINTSSFIIHAGSSTFPIPASYIKIAATNDSITINFDTTLIKQVGNFNNKFERNENFELSYIVKPMNCGINGSISSNLSVWWGCNGCISQIGNAVFNMDVNYAGSPNLVLTTIAPAKICLGLVPNSYTIKMVNNGNGSATNIIMEMFSYYSNAQRGVYYMDTAAVNYKIGINGSFIHPTFSGVEVRSGTYYSGAYNCSIAGKPHHFKFVIPTLAANDTIYINYNVQICNSNYCSPVSNSVSLGLNGVNYNLSYKNQCGLNDYSQNNIVMIPYLGPSIYTSTQFPSDISDTQTKEFTILTSNENFASTSNSFVRSTSAYYEVTLTLPAGLEFDNSLPDGVKWYNAARTDFWGGTTVTGTNPVVVRFPISGKPINFNTTNSELVYKLKGVCGFTGIKTINVSYKFVPDPTNVCGTTSDIQLMCFNKTINLHCPSSFSAGANLYSFNQSRKNYGLVDNDNNGTPDGSGTMNMSNVKTDRLMYGDTLQTIFKSVIKTDGSNPLFQYAYAKLAIASLAANFSYAIPASVRIKRASDGTVITGTVVAINDHDSLYYNLSTIGGNTFYDGDSLQVISNIIVKTNIGGAYNTYVSRGDFYASHVVNPIGINRFSNDFLGSTVSIIGYYFVIWQQTVNPLSFTNGCENKQLNIGYYLSIGPCCSNYNGGNLFPYEARRWSFLDSVKITMPQGYTIISSTFSNYRTGGTNVSVTEPGGTITPSNVSGSTYTYKFHDFYYQFGGNKMNISDDGWYLTQSYTIQPSGLISPMNVSKPVTITAYFGSANQIPATTTPPSTQSQLVYTGAIPDLIANTPVVDAYTKNVQWRASLQNASGTIPAPNNWIYIKNTGSGISITEVKCNNIVILPNGNGFYELGNLNGGILKNLIIKANTNSCSNDSIKVYTGYSCNGTYPTSINIASTAKSDSISLIAHPKLAQITADLTSLANTPINPADPNSPLYGSNYVTMCDSFPVQLQIISAQPGTIYDIRELIQLPTNSSGNSGIGFASGSGYIEYPIGTTPRPFSSTANAALSIPGLTNLTMDLAQIDPANFSSPIKGLIGSMHPDSNKVILRFKFSANCNLPSRSAFKIVSKAKAPCGSNASGDGAMISSTVLPIYGVVNSNAANVDFSITPSTNFTNCNPIQNGLVIVEKIGPNPINITDSIFITMPAIFNIIDPIICNGMFCPGPNPIVKNDIIGDQRIIRWQFPQNFNILPNNGSGIEVRYSFAIQLLSTINTVPQTVSMSAQVVEQSIVMCGTNTCPNSTSIIGESVLNDVHIGGSVIGISEDITEINYINNFSYDVTYRMILKNYGNVALNNVQVMDTLMNTFTPPSSYSIISKTATGNLSVASNYNGSTFCSILNNSSTLDINTADTITLKINVSTNGNYGPFYNQSYAQANNSYNCLSYDLSDNGSDPDPNGDNNPNELGENDPTPLQFNAPPITFNENVSIDEDHILNGISILSNGDFDPDGTTLAINDTIPTINTQHGTILLLSNGTYTYTPALNYNGNDMAVFKIYDSGIPLPGLYTNDTINILVNPVNDPPITFNDTASTSENTPIIKTQIDGILANGDYDPDGTTLFMNTTPLHGPLHGTIALNTNGSYIYTPNQYYNGYDTIIVSVCDNGIPVPSLCTNDTIFISISGLNNPPITFNEIETTDEDIPIVKSAFNGILSNGDYDPEATILLVNTTPIFQPTHGNISFEADGSYTYTPFENYNGYDTIVVSICDNGMPMPSECSNDTLFIQILPINDPPLTINETYITTANIEIIRDAANGILSNGDIDPEGTTLTINTLTIIGPSNGLINIQPDGSFIYTPNNNYIGNDMVIVDVCDNGIPLPSACSKDTIFIQVETGLNHPPVTVNNYVVIPINTTIDIDPNSNNYDPDNNIDTTATTILINPKNGVALLNASNGIINYIPNTDYVGYDTIVVSICDKGTPVYCANDTIFIEVQPIVNHPPVTVNNYVVIPINTTIDIDPNSNNYDPDNNIDTTATTILINPKNGVALLNASNGITNYIPNTDYVGYDTIVVSICDKGMPIYCTNDTIFIEVQPIVNHPPVTINNYVVIPINTTIDIDPNSNNYDPDNNIDTTATTILINPKNGVTLLNTTNGFINYKPNNNFSGYDTIVVSICDKGMPIYCANDTIFIEVTPTTTKAVIGLAKTNTEISRSINGSFDITYFLTVQNLGDEDLKNVQVFDSLSKVFPYPAAITTIRRPFTTGTISPNPDYNGQSDCNLLLSDTSSLIKGNTSTITFTINVLLSDTTGAFLNSAFATAYGAYGAFTSDISDNGIVTDANGNGNPNENGENDPTPIELSSSFVFIPQGFSPNGDGVDDVFIIYGNGTNKASISVYNRWGNLVFQENDYKNDWDGKANKGLSTNSVLPDGTYFYVIDMHNGQKNKVGSFIIKR